MLTLQDCIGICGLNPDQVEAIADHEHLNMIIAAEWAECMLDRPDGTMIVRHVLEDEAAQCRAAGDFMRSRRYQVGLSDFNRSH